MAAKDFGSIESDYLFFMTHATEAESDAAEYERELAGFADGKESLRMLDFGCGTGAFTRRLLTDLNLPLELLQLTLVEPVSIQRAEAARQLAAFSEHSITALPELPSGDLPEFDLIISNHVLYYVDDLHSILLRLKELLAIDGKLLLAIAGWDNALIQIWRTGFEGIGRPVPYHVSEDVEKELTTQGMLIQKSESSYQLKFQDTTENRNKILRFLFGEHLHAMDRLLLQREFDRFVRGDNIEIKTSSAHFVVMAEPSID